MRITIQVTCESPEDAQDVIARLTRPRTWEDDLDARQRKPGAVSEARLDQIMGGVGAAAPVHSGKDYSKDEEPARLGGETVFQTKPNPIVRGNVNPGEPNIIKLGGETKDTLLGLIKNGQQPASKWSEHCKLLWKRGEIKFDGKDYYI